MKYRSETVNLGQSQYRWFGMSLSLNRTSLEMWGREEIVDYLLFESSTTLPYCANLASNEVGVRWHKNCNA